MYIFVGWAYFDFVVHLVAGIYMFWFARHLFYSYKILLVHTTWHRIAARCICPVVSQQTTRAQQVHPGPCKSQYVATSAGKLIRSVCIPRG